MRPFTLIRTIYGYLNQDLFGLNGDLIDSQFSTLRENLLQRVKL